MRHNQNNPSFKFYVEPDAFDKNTDKPFLQYCLGATLYLPGTKNILEKIINQDLSGLTSMVLCFEDAIQEADLPEATRNVKVQLDGVFNAVEVQKLAIDDVPLIFIRVRNVKQFYEFSAGLTPEMASVLTGFVFPKFNSGSGREYFDRLNRLNQRLGARFYGMPILEGKEMAFKETRSQELAQLMSLFQEYSEDILNLRVGGTDISALFGLRRGIDFSIYDLAPVRRVLSDVLNCFTRMADGYVISGPVWEYFLNVPETDGDIVLKNGDLLRSLFTRIPVVNSAVDGLLREVVMDTANGFVGKTVIHPSHIRFVNAMQAVTREDYEDAEQIMAASGGVVKSLKENKMNEVNPHRNWARKVMCRARAYGVVETQADYLRLVG